MPQRSDGNKICDKMTCSLCTWVVAEIEKALDIDELDEDQIIQMLEGKCNETFAANPILLDTCIGLVDVTVRDIIEILEGGLEPESVCGMISLCDSDSNKTITYFKN